MVNFLSKNADALFATSDDLLKMKKLFGDDVINPGVFKAKLQTADFVNNKFNFIKVQ